MTTTPTNQPPDPDELARLRAENARLREQPVPAHGFEDRWRPELDGGKRSHGEESADIIQRHLNGACGCAGKIESLSAEWERLGDYGTNQEYMAKIRTANEILAALQADTGGASDG